MNKRKAISLFDEDTATTFLRPYSGEYHNCLIVITEDAHGEFNGIITPIKDIKNKLNITDEELAEMIVKLI